MDIYTQLRNLLQQKYLQGATDQEIADQLNCSSQHVNRLRNGKRSFSNMRLATILKLFPGLQVSLDGSPLHGSYQSVNGNGNIVAGRDAHASATPCAAEVESFRSGLLEGVIDLDIDDAAKVSILRYVRDFNKR
jgi:transcriptional regulator with XRE-family HTH domain